MDESMKKSMEEARKRYFCDVWAMSHARSPRSINEIDFNGGWKYAIEACLEYLGKAAGEWNESLAKENADDGEWLGGSHGRSVNTAWLKGAKWQFEQDKARIALAESDLADKERDFEKMSDLEHDAQCKVKELESKLSAAEAELLQLKETAMDTCECYDKDPVGLAHVIIDLKALARR